MEILKKLLKMLRETDPETYFHTLRVTKVSAEIGELVRLSAREQGLLRCGAMLHDLGKLFVPKVILEKPSGLTEAEYGIVKKHPETGVTMAKEFHLPNEVLEIILYHHERVNGKGYPYGLKRDEIPHLARIVSIADAFDAMTSDRPYRRPMSTEKAVKIIEENLGTQFDSEYGSLFIQSLAGGGKKCWLSKKESRTAMSFNEFAMNRDTFVNTLIQ
ncbi:HD-GYP domain-containing protein [Microaerobacter geothermalis]|uniref:HD-GYP domain-containing protein n=1 Tax=Microaerobacter geothermalis TaxID=674972 RepID=UPI001F2C3992|nr:HD-GYP domain-containing protein [Microaerobacter geothermalis]MCF6094323.1 HD-GYP domain-containing protein [Microaerobacter geothermalis]